MNILSRTEYVKAKAKAFGRYKEVANQSGVGYEWLTKFANNKITNPGVENVAKLDTFFSNLENKSDAA